MTATYILNRVPSKSVLSTPYELWKCVMPDLNVISLWGVRFMFIMFLMNMGSLVLRGRNVFHKILRVL